MKALLTFLTVFSPLAAASATQSTKPSSIVPPAPQLDVKLPAVAYLKEDGSVAVTSTTYRPTETAALPKPHATPMFPGLDRNRLHYDVDAREVHWARGATYKASFGEGEATYIPFFGSKAPRNYPVSFRLSSVTVGGEPLSFDEQAAATRAADTIYMDRGTLVETYELTPKSMEQSFVFAEQLEGEIVVQIGVETELAQLVDESGFRFENELGYMHYGHAFALDAAGMKLQLEASLENGTITIRVPEEFVAAATFPLVIDPVGTTFTLESALIDEFLPDTSFDFSNGTWVTVCEEVFSLTDHDIHAVRHTSTGSVSATEYIDFTGDFWARPRIANHNILSTFLVVAQVGSVGAREIMGRTISASIGLMLGSVNQYSDNALPGDVLNADVGGDPSMSAPAYFLVVWERVYGATDRDIHARLVHEVGVPNGATILIDNSSATIDIEPAISNSNGHVTAADQDWTIAWTRQGAGDDDILGARVHWNGAITESTFSVGFTAQDERAASVTPILLETGLGQRYLVAYQIDGGTQGWNVRLRAFDNTTILSTIDSNSIWPSATDFEQTMPSCDTDGHSFVVAYRENPSIFATTEVVVSTLYLVGSSLGVTEAHVSVTPGLELDSRPEIVAKRSSGSFDDDALVVFDRSESGDLQVLGTLYHIPIGGPIEAYCFGDGTGTACPCGNSGAAGRGCASSVNASGAVLTSTGNALLSSDSFRLHGAGMGATATGLYFQGTATLNAGNGTAFGDGLRCAGGSVIRLATKTSVSGASFYPLPGELEISVRGIVPAGGAVRYYQLWYRNNAAFCTPSNFNLTNALRVVWIP